MDDIFRFEGFRLHRPGGGLYRRDERGDFVPMAIGSRALDVLGVLVGRSGDLVSRGEIIAAVWPSTVVEDSNLNMQIAALRRVLDDGRAEGSCIQTIPGRGYRFTAAVTRVEAAARSDAVGLPQSSVGPQRRLSIVVLPFANLSSNPNQQYFADGITDDLTTDLSRISGSFVIAHSTAITYKDRPIDVKEVGRELGVRYVLEGSVRRTGELVRVNVQLVDAESGAHLWAEQFDTQRANLLEAQDEITGRLARTLNLELAEDVGRRIEHEALVHPDARDLVMRGWAWFYQPRSRATVQEALVAFERALSVDPQSIDARIGIATILVTNLTAGLDTSVQRDEARSERLLQEALERDTNHSMAHYAMGVLRRSQARLTEARIELETAIALDRNNARAFHQLGHTLRYLGEPEAAIPHIEKGIRLNPRDPFVAHYYYALGSCHLFLGCVDLAVDLLTRACAGNPRYWYIHLWLAAALGLKGDLEAAKAAVAQGIQLEPHVSSLAEWRAHGRWGINPKYIALAEKTLYAGLRRAGFPDE